MKRTTVLISTIIILSEIVCYGMGLLPEAKLSEGAGVTYDNGSFVIEGPYLKTPLIMGSEELPVCYETGGQKYYLRDKPISVEHKDNSSYFAWSLGNGKEVILKFTREKGLFKINFDALPSSEIAKWSFSFDAEPDEYFTGLMERAVDGDQELSWELGIQKAMDLRGQTVEMFVLPTISVYCPFYISSRNYSLLVEGTWPGSYDFCSSDSDTVKISFEGPAVSMLLNTANTPAELVKVHSLYAGPSILPPKWAFSPWRWRNNHTQRTKYYDGTDVNAPYNSELVEDVLMMEAYDIPTHAYIIDRPWAIGSYGYDDFEWDDERFPNAVEMLGWMNEKKINPILWIAPWNMGKPAKESIEKNYHVKNQIGYVNERVLLDFTNPEAVEWWKEIGPGKLLKQGVMGFKMDRSEQMVPYDIETRAFDGRTVREYHNDYPVMYAKAAYEICRKIRGNDFVTLPRAAYTNSSRYATFWGGDTGNVSKGDARTTPESLRSAIIALLRSAVIGFPIWGSDTGGYVDIIDHEIMARWLGFSCFCPIMEVGPTEDKGLWDLSEEPHYDTELIAIWRLYAKIHESLKNYTYKCAKEAARTGMPIARPLFLKYHTQKHAWNNWQTYTYGPDILVSPIWRSGKVTHSLYLPAGDKWVDAWDRTQVYEGGKYVNVEAPIHKIPIFIRAGSGVNLGDLNALYEESLKIAAQRPDLEKLQEAEFAAE